MGKKYGSQYPETIITQRIHLTQCIQQLVLHVSFQIYLLPKTPLQTPLPETYAINTGMQIIPITSYNHYCNKINGSPIVNWEWARQSAAQNAGFKWDNGIEEVCFHMESKYSSIYCTQTRYLVLCQVNLVRSVTAQCTQSILFFTAEQTTGFSFPISFWPRDKKKCIKGKFPPMPTLYSFFLTPLPIWNSFLPSAMKYDVLCSHHSESKIHRSI